MVRLICLITSTTLLCCLEASWHFKQGKCGLDGRIKDALNSPGKLKKLYEDYKVEHEVDHNTRETPKRLEIFKQFLVKVQELKADERVSWNVGITFMAHMTECEKSLYHGVNKTRNEQWESNDTLQSGLEAGNPRQYPKSFDWRQHGGVTPVHHQIGDSCWAHAAVVPLEGQLYVFKGKLKELSTQELIDCVYYGTSDYNKNVGGSKEEAWFWILDNHHLASRSDVPDRRSVKNCWWINQARHSNALSGFRIKSLHEVRFVDDDELPLIQTLVTLSPVAVTMHTKNAHLDAYMGGPYDWRATSCQAGMSHAMAIVGYDSQYYIIKNSWGTNWGDSGYLWWVRAPISGYNCFLFSDASYPWLVYKEELQSQKD